MDIIAYIRAHGYGNSQLLWRKPNGETVGVIGSEYIMYKKPYNGFFVSITKVYDFYGHQTYCISVYENEYTYYVEESLYIDDITEILQAISE